MSNQIKEIFARWCINNEVAQIDQCENFFINKPSKTVLLSSILAGYFLLSIYLSRQELLRRIKILGLLYLIDFKKNKKEKQILKNNIIKFIIFFSTFIFSTYASTYSDFFVMQSTYFSVYNLKIINLV